MKYVFGIGLVAVVVGVLWFMSATPTTPSVSTTDEMAEVAMESAAGLSVRTEDDLEYFAGARGFYAEPMGEDAYPGVVMIHENRGLRPEIKQAAETLAKEGYRVLAVDLYQGTVMETQDEARAYSTQFDQAEGIRNMQAAVAFLNERGSEKIASLGWCFGGKQSLELAMSGTPLAATVVYYGGGMATTTERLAPITWPVLGIFGDQDRVIPLEMVSAFESSLDALSVPNEVHIYEGVGHAFANPSNPNFAPEATADAWAKTLTFLEQNL